MSTLSDYTVRLLHRSMQVDVRALLGKSLTLTIETAAAPRHINGVIASFALVGQEGDADRYFVYEARVVPWFWLATHKKEFRIYQNQSVPETIKQVLAPYGYAFEFDLVESYTPRIYCVQYDETDFQFVSRLLEAEGIHYYFRHEQEKHTLVMSDEIQSHKPVDGYEHVPYFTEDKLTLPQQDYMTHVAVFQDLRPGQYTTNDYNFTTPKADLAARQQIKLDHSHNEAEVYEWPGNYGDDPLGERYARQRMQEQHHIRDTRTLRSTARGVATASLFNLVRCPRTEENREYVVLGTRYDLKENNYHSVSSPDEAAQNGRRCVFDLTVQCATLPFRPPRITRKPRTLGPQTAVVVGPEGKEIWTNEYGQVKVHFHWDRYDKKDENSSCWIRVSSSWASSNFGAIQVPRIGDEVIVDFLNGDPDAPIITGRVYNAAMMPPWKLPENETQMGIYSRSSPGGNYYTANAFRFEDKTGREEIYIHAQKDRNEKTQNNHTERIDNNWVQSIGHNKVIEVANNHEEVVGGSVSIFIGPQNIGTFVSKILSRASEGLGNIARAIGLEKVLGPGRGHYFLGVEKTKSEVVGLASSELVGTVKTVNAGVVMRLGAGKDLEVQAGEELELRAGRDATLTGDEVVELRAGTSRVVLRENGDILIAGTRIAIDATDSIELEAANTVRIKADRIDLN